MIMALDKDNKRVHIDAAVSKGDYFCPSCGKPLVMRKGEIRQHHFAHKASACLDEWERNGYYDMSEWHLEWQRCYPCENQEIVLQVGNIRHRADVLIGRTVIEFQHSPLSARMFNERNNFYQSLGYKVIWVFDFIEQFEKDSIHNLKEHDFSWDKPRLTFNTYEVCSGAVDVFFQLKTDEEKCLVKISEVSPNGFEHFKISGWYSKSEFLEYTGMKNGTCPLPELMDEEEDKDYMKFCETYQLKLNNQQARAVQAVDGAVLLLAVPGSGKTTVLTARVAYMILCKQIPAENILVMTYTKSAADDMKQRFYKKFGKNIKNQVHFCTINSLAKEIIDYYCRQYKKTAFRIIGKEEEFLRDSIIRKIYKKIIPNSFITESELLEIKASISYIKNKMLFTSQEMKECRCSIPNIGEFYKQYQNELIKLERMDFDDQIDYAYKLLKDTSKSDILSYFQSCYPYICVDEAQDTSKLQHELIRLLVSKKNHIFMVGDEDQSIYGFRGAYPRALLNFKENYPNAFVLTMEKNYRSVPEIVETASSFVKNNIGHYPKQMTAVRSDSGTISAISVKNKLEQYRYLADIIKKNPNDTAILYRSHDSLIPLADYLIRNNIYYKASKQNFTFFTNKVITDIKSFLIFSLNPYDTKSFMQIYYKCGYSFNKKTAEWTCQRAIREHLSIPDALIKQLSKYPKLHRNAQIFKCFIEHISTLSPSKAIAYILKNGYQEYMEEKNMDVLKANTLLAIAESEPTIASFLNRLEKLPNLMKHYNSSSSNIEVILSTIHSSKGMEYDTVYLPDIVNGILPSVSSFWNMNKRQMEDYQEDRRLFYVGMTRAKNHLFFMKIENCRQNFLNEIFNLSQDQYDDEVY